LAFDYGAWIWKKQNKQWRRLIQGYAVHINQGLNFMIALKGWDGYYWPTMVQDCIDYAKRCDACQFHANFIHQPSEPLHPTVDSWPFEAGGLMLLGQSRQSHLLVTPTSWLLLITSPNGQKQFY